MSGETVGWVFKYSPYSGVPLNIHLAIADSVSDMHEFKFWMNSTKLAVKARTTRSTAATTLAVMVRDGFLELLEDGAPRRKPSLYRFLMPKSAALVFDAMSKTDELDPMAVRAAATRVRPRGLLEQPTRESQDSYARLSDEPTTLLDGATSLVGTSDTYTKSDTKKNPNNPPTPHGALVLVQPDVLPSVAGCGDGFAQFWQAYPRKTAKNDALKAWKQTAKSRPPIEVLLRAVAEYRETDEVVRGYIQYPATWLRAGRWDDEPAPRRSTGDQDVWVRAAQNMGIV